MPLRPRIGAARPQPAPGTVAPTFNGINLASPAPKPLPAVSGAFNITDAINQAQTGQNQANAANALRYNQGLSVLGSGMDQSRNFISQALQASQGLGQTAYSRIGEQEQSRIGGAQQDAISRGLNNTTIAMTMQAGAQRDAERARQDVDEQVANRRIGINLQASGNERSGAGEIANFIAGRNDLAPSLGEYAGLVQGAASDASGAQRTGSVIRGGSSGGGALGTGGLLGGNFGGSSGGLSSGGGGSSGSNSAGSFTMGGGPISSALSPAAPGPVMSSVGVPQAPSPAPQEQYTQAMLGLRDNPSSTSILVNGSQVPITAALVAWVKANPGRSLTEYFGK